MFLFLIALSTTISQKQVEYRLSRNYGQLIYDFSGNSRHSSNGNSVLSPLNDAMFTDRGLYVSGSACTMPTSTNENFKVPNPGTIILWAMTSSIAGKFFHQYIDLKNTIVFRKGPSNNLVIWYNFNTSSKIVIEKEVNTLVSGKFYLDVWIMVSVVISGNLISVYQNLVQVASLDYGATYIQTYRIVLGSCLVNDYATNTFMYYFAVLNSSTIHESFIGPHSSNCLTGVGTCTPCSNSIILDYSNESGCISTSSSITSDSYGKNCQIGFTCVDSYSIKCLCPSLSCYYNTTSTFQCVDYNTGFLSLTVSNCSAIGHGCCLPECLDCIDEGNCISCIAKNAEVDTDGLCSCIDGFFGTRPLILTNSCSLCMPECLQCDNSYSCTKCLALNSNFGSSGCVCDPGFYQSGPLTNSNSCLKCGDGCIECINSTNCIKCADENSIVELGECNCIEGFYLDVSASKSSSCIKCKSDCKTCDNPFNCTSCVNIQGKLASNGCVCIDGYWSEGDLINEGSCIECRKDCLTCNNSESCEICIDQNAEVYESKCLCKQGFYGIGLISKINPCIKCNEDCLLCSSKDICESCKLPEKVLDGGICKCKKGYFSTNSDDGSDICIKCQDLCSICGNDGKCIKCSKFSSLNEDECKCNQGYINFFGFCSRKKFSANILIINSIVVILTFNETLKLVLNEKDVQINIESGKIEFKMKELTSLSEYEIIPKLSRALANTSIHINLNPSLTSSSFSILFPTQYTTSISYNSTKIENKKSSSSYSQYRKISRAGTISAAAFTLGVSFIKFDSSSFFNFINLAELIYSVYLLNLELNPALREFLLGMRIHSSIPNIFKYFIHEEKNLPVKYQKFGYKSQMLLINGGILFTILLFNILALSVAAIFYMVPLFKLRLKNLIKWIIFESMIKFWLQSFFELGVVGFVMFRYSDFNMDVTKILDFSAFFGLIVRFI